MNSVTFDWDEVRVFLAVAGPQNLSAAARELQLSQPTVGRHIAKFEERLGIKLFDRRQTGYFLTDAGKRLAPVAHSMAQRAADFKKAADLEKLDAPEQVCRITAGEWGQFFLSSRFQELTADIPNVRLEVHADDAFWDLSRDAADIAVSNRSPKQGHLISQRLGTVGFHVYVSEMYLNEHPEAFDRQSWRGQKWVGYSGAKAKLPSSRLVEDLLQDRFPDYCVNSAAALLNTVESAQALGILPDWIGENTELVRLTETPLATRESWLSFHERLRLHPNLSTVKDRIADLYRNHLRDQGTG